MFRAPLGHVGWSVLRHVTLSLCVGVLVLFLAGCSGEHFFNQSRQLKLQFATWGSPEELVVISDLARQFEEQHPDIYLDVMHIPENYDQKIHMLAASGLLPDVLAINSWTYPKYACYGLLADLKPHLNQSTNRSERGKGELREADFYPTALQAFGDGTSKPSTLGAIPRDVSDVVMFVNTSLLKQTGIQQPSRYWDWPEFKELAQRVTKDTDGDGRTDVYGTSFYRQPPLFWLPWVWMAGGSLWDEQGHLALDTPVAVAGLRFYHDLVASGVAPSRQQTGQTTMTQLFVQQKLATMVNGRWVVPLLRQQAQTEGDKFEWDVWPLPAGPKGSITGVDATGYAMSAETQHPKAAWAWIAFLSSQNASATFAKSGLIVPARRDVAESEAFLSPAQMPQHSSVFLEVLDSGRPTQSHPNLEYYSNALKVGLEPVWDRPTAWSDNELSQRMTELMETINAKGRSRSVVELKSGVAACPR